MPWPLQQVEKERKDILPFVHERLCSYCHPTTFSCCHYPVFNKSIDPSLVDIFVQYVQKLWTASLFMTITMEGRIIETDEKHHL